MDFIEAEVEVVTTATMMDEDDVNDILSENEDDKNFIDDSMEIKSQQQLSDCFKLRNAARSISSFEEVSFSQSDIDDSIDFDVEAGNYIPYRFDPRENDDLENDSFNEFKKRIQKFKDELLMPYYKSNK